MNLLERYKKLKEAQLGPPGQISGKTMVIQRSVYNNKEALYNAKFDKKMSKSEGSWKETKNFEYAEVNSNPKIYKLKHKTAKYDLGFAAQFGKELGENLIGVIIGAGGGYAMKTSDLQKILKKEFPQLKTITVEKDGSD